MTYIYMTCMLTNQEKQILFTVTWQNSLSLSGSFEYLCYGSTTIRNILIISVGGQSNHTSGSR